MSTIMNDSKAGARKTRTQVSPIDKFASVALLDTHELKGLLSAALTELEAREGQEAVPVVEGVRNRPAWSDPRLDVVDRDKPHPGENGVWVKGIVDEWAVEETTITRPGGVLRRACTVYLEGIRHDTAPHMDWPDVVRVDLATDGMDGDTIQRPEDVRRLAAALTRAADLLEGGDRA